MTTKRRRSQTLIDLTGFEIAILCALPIESEAVESTFDEIYQNKEILWQKVDGDQNAYTLGRIGVHNVVLAYMPRMGKIRAASTASSLRVTFSGIKLALVVGVCGGATQTPDKQDIFLGDVIISTQLQQGDFGREYPDGIDSRDAMEGGLRPTPPEIAAFLHQAQTKHSRKTLFKTTRDSIDSLLSYVEATSPTTESDLLYSSNYLHKHHQSSPGMECVTCQSNNIAICETAKRSTCRQLGCDTTQQARQRTRPISTGPSIHFGAIATIDIVKKNEVSRDHYAKEHKVLAFEMEGAGVWEIFPTIVVKAVCDYADSHKNKMWQQYAAVSAAACCKSLLSQWVPSTQQILGRPAREDYLGSLDFEQIDSRYHDIRFAYPKTCDWVFSSPEFREWLNPNHAEGHHRVLWIKGKPGSGKSTTMKHIYGASERLFPECTVAAYFFHGRGSELQKTRLGMLRSLLHQLLKYNESLLQTFMEAFPSRNQSAKNRKWMVEELENFLLHCARQGWIKDSVLLIDALDECGESTARGLVSFCENLALNSISLSNQLFICLSIRHFPSISMNRYIQLNIDQKAEHDSDIEKYVSSIIQLKNAALINQITRKARHVFLWAVLVVQILNQLYDQGGDLQNMLGRLAQIPDTLHEIFNDLIQLDGGIREQGILAFRLVLFALRPLTPQVLYLLVMSGHDPSQSWKWDRNSMDGVRLKNWITTQSRGLLEIASTHQSQGISRGYFAQRWHLGQPSSLNEHALIVQVIHESVRDFLLAPENLLWLKDEEAQSHNAACHKSIVDCCMSSMIAGLSALGTAIVTQYPHIMYALQFLPFHIEQAQLTKEDFAHLIQQYASVLRGYSWNYHFEAHWPGSPYDDLLLRAIMTINKGIVNYKRFMGSSERLLDAILNDPTIINHKIPGSILFFVEGRGWAAAMKRLTDAGADVLVKDTNGRSLIDTTFADLSRRVNTDRPNIDDQVELACVLVTAYTQAGHDVNVAEGSDIIPLVAAIEIGSTKLVNSLLHAGTNPDIARRPVSTWEPRQPALALTLVLCATKPKLLTRYKDIVFMLLDHNASWIDTDEAAQALFDVLAHGDVQLMEALIKHKVVAPKHHDLIKALSKHYFEIAGLFLRSGLRPDDPEISHDPLLHMFAYWNVPAMNWLLQNHTDPNIKDRKGRTALHRVIEGNRKGVIEDLLAHADPNITDQEGLTALHMAVRSNQLEVCDMLMEHGARTDILCNKRTSPLSLAMQLERAHGKGLFAGSLIGDLVAKQGG